MIIFVLVSIMLSCTGLRYIISIEMLSIVIIFMEMTYSQRSVPVVLTFVYMHRNEIQYSVIDIIFLTPVLHV